ncbi:MAG: PIN domain nuclease [Rhizobiaceae bacterium]
MLVADTSVWIDYFRNPRSPFARQLDGAILVSRIIVPDLILLEILRGIPNEHQARKVERMMLEFEMVAIGGKEMARSAAANYRLLRSKGITPRGSIDLLIATWCIENRIPLLHKDRDFTMMEGHLGLPTVSVMN